MSRENASRVKSVVDRFRGVVRELFAPRQAQAEAEAAVLLLTDAFRRHDVDRLANMTPAQRAEQADARRVLFEYVDAMWDEAKAAGKRPDDDPDFDAVTAMRDLTFDLYFGHIHPAQRRAGRIGSWRR